MKPTQCKSVVRRKVLSVPAAGLAAGLTTHPALGWAAQSPERGGSLSIALEFEVNGLDPLVMSSLNDRQAGFTVYDALIDIDAKGHLVPGLAEKWEVAPDATWFKLSLRKGVQFHDGTPFDAAAVVAHIKRLMDPKLRYRFASDLSGIASIEASGPLEVSIKMNTPSAQFLALLSDFSGMVVSPTAAEKLGDEFRNNPVGTGPFVFKEWRRGSQIVFTRNDKYWRGPVWLDEVVLRPMPDEQTRIASLKAGNLDVALAAPSKDVIEARQGKKLVVHDPGSLATVFVMVNTSKPDVSDIRVRRALAHAIDRKAVVRVIDKGLSQIANTPFGSGLSPHELVDGYPQYDPAGAKKLLAAYGKPVNIKISVSSNPIPMQYAQIIQQMWKKVGVNSEILPYETVQLIRQAGLKDYETMMYRWAGGIDPDRNVYMFFHSKGSANRTYYNNPEMDKLLDAGRATMDPAKRKEIYHQVSNLLARDLPYLFLHYFTNYNISQANIKGIDLIPDGIVRVRKVWKAR